MNRDRIIEQLKAILHHSTGKQIDGDAMSLDCPMESLGFDSLTVLDLLYDIQQDFNVQFETEELAAVKTIADLVTFLERKGA